jgi:hypothetical protein
VWVEPGTTKGTTITSTHALILLDYMRVIADI